MESEIKTIGTTGTNANHAVIRYSAIRNELVRESFMLRKPHHLESLLSVRGVLFVNDSRAACVNATWYALEMMNRPVVWIAGGRERRNDNDYMVLTGLVKKKVKAIVCLGADTLRFHDAFARHVDVIVNTMSMTEAVNIAFYLADPGDVVLLSPACTSFDLFEDYEDRGEQFRRAVRGL